MSKGALGFESLFLRQLKSKAWNQIVPGFFVTFAGGKENGLAPATGQNIIGILFKNDVLIDDSSFFDNFVLVVNYPFSRLRDS